MEPGGRVREFERSVCCVLGEKEKENKGMRPAKESGYFENEWWGANGICGRSRGLKHLTTFLSFLFFFFFFYFFYFLNYMCIGLGHYRNGHDEGISIMSIGPSTQKV